MAFLGNDAVNRVNLHSGIMAIAQSGGGIFLLAFLVQVGVSVPAALLAIAAIQGLRFLLRPLVLPLAVRYGVKPLLVVGAFVLALQYPLLARVDAVGAALLLFCVVLAIGDVLYWPSYHTLFAVLGDAHHRGHQVSARDALVAAVGIVAPLLGAWALVTLGPMVAFACIGGIQAVSVVPLLRVRNPVVQAEAPNPWGSARLAAQLALTWGWFEGWYLLVWPLALFLLLDSSVAAFGGAMALAALAGAVAGMLLGRLVDGGHGRRTAWLACGVTAALVVARAGSGGAPALAVLTTTLGAFAPPLLSVASGPALYNLAQLSPCPMRFHLVTEAGWDIGCASSCVFAAALVASGVPMAPSILLALPALAVLALMLRRFYPAAG